MSDGQLSTEQGHSEHERWIMRKPGGGEPDQVEPDGVEASRSTRPLNSTPFEGCAEGGPVVVPCIFTDSFECGDLRAWTPHPSTSTPPTYRPSRTSAGHLDLVLLDDAEPGRWTLDLPDGGKRGQGYTATRESTGQLSLRIGLQPTDPLLRALEPGRRREDRPLTVSERCEAGLRLAGCLRPVCGSVIGPPDEDNPVPRCLEWGGGR